MNKITIIFFALSAIFVYSEDLASKQLISKYSIKQGTQIVEIINYPNIEWLNAQQFAIYGWFRVNQWIQTSTHILSLSFSKKSDSFQAHNQYMITVSDNQFVLTTYNANNYDPSQQIGRLTFDNKDFGSWIFIYHAFDMQQQKMFTYMKSPNKAQEINDQKYISHINAERVQLIIGPKYLIQNGNQIDMKNINIKYGNNSYQDSNFDSLIQTSNKLSLRIQSNQTLNEQGKLCTYLYSECAFQGKSISFCDQQLQGKVDDFKSIFIAPNDVFIASSLPNSSEVYYLKISQSIECFDLSKIQSYAAQGRLQIQQN